MSWLRLMEEKIKEAEAMPVSDQAEAQQPVVSKRNRRVIALIKEMWPAYLIEIFVIILGITITLALEQWRDAAKEKQLEKTYLKNLLSDLNSDLQILTYADTSTRNLLSKCDDLIRFVNGSVADSGYPNRLVTDLRVILERPNFLSSDATFSDLKSSGNLHLLKDISLKNLLFSYYGLVQDIKENQDAERQATIVISGSYFLKRFPLANSSKGGFAVTTKDVQDLAKNIEFENNVLLRASTRKELSRKYQKAIGIANQLRQMIAKSEE